MFFRRFILLYSIFVAGVNAQWSEGCNIWGLTGWVCWLLGATTGHGLPIPGHKVFGIFFKDVKGHYISYQQRDSLPKTYLPGPGEGQGEHREPSKNPANQPGIGMDADQWLDYMIGPGGAMGPRPPKEKVEGSTTEGIDQDYIDDLINLDYGHYTNMDYAFRYFNAQNYYPPIYTPHPDDTCFEDYIRCIFSFVYNTRICGYTGGWHSAYMKNFYSPCELWLVNCRIQLRLWFSTGARQENQPDTVYIAGCKKDNW